MKQPKRVVLVAADWPELEKFCPNFNGMRRGLERLGIPYRFITCRGPGSDFKPDIDAIVDFEPELVVYCLRDMIKRKEWRKEIRERLPAVPIVMWYGDFRDESTWQDDADCSKHIDCMFISNDAQEQYYKVKWRMPRVEFLPLGCEPIAEPQFDAKFALPFIFVGGQITGGPFYKRAHDIGRYKAHDQLLILNSFEPMLRAKIMRAIPRIYSSAKVALDISHFTDKQGYTSNRYWVIPANFGFALTKRWPGCTDFYPEDSRVYFDTYEEAIEKKNYYLEHETERLAMIAKARKHVDRHSYDKRFRAMFEKI